MQTMINFNHVQLAESAIQSVAEVLRSGQLRGSTLVHRFEEAFASVTGAKEAVAVSSGTMALYLSYLALLEPGDEVLVPSFTHMSTVNMIYLAGGIPVLCDIDPDTWTIDPVDAANKISPGTRAITPVHLYGNACSMEPLMELASRHNLVVIWDACQAHCTRYKGRDVGSYGDVVCYSFYPSKAMTTGEGGMITTDSTSLADRLRRLRNQGQDFKYLHGEIGVNGRMTEIAAAIGLVELTELQQRIEARRRNAALLDEVVTRIPGFATQKVTPDSTHSYHQYCIRVDYSRTGWSRRKVMDWLQQRGIATAVHYPRPAHMQPCWPFDARFDDLPVSESLADEVFSIPVHHRLTPTDLDTMRQALLELGREISHGTSAD